MATITYKIDGADVRTYGVHVSAATGLLSLPERKAGVSRSYDDEHGISVDTSRVYVKERQIKLTCFTDKMTHSSAILAMNVFKSILMQPGLHRMEVVISGCEPLCYDVYMAGKTDVTTKYNGSSQVATFTMTLTEPQPVKRVLKVVITAANQELEIDLSTTEDKYFEFSWGDGAVIKDLVGGDTATHTYASAGTYYCLMKGDTSVLSTAVSNDSNMTTTEIWNVLM